MNNAYLKRISNLKQPLIVEETKEPKKLIKEEIGEEEFGQEVIGEEEIEVDEISDEEEEKDPLAKLEDLLNQAQECLVKLKGGDTEIEVEIGDGDNEISVETDEITPKDYE